MTYSEKLRHPKWQKKRLEIFQRDGFRCIFCGSGIDDGTNLQVHHILYKKRDPWDYPDYLYQSLCEHCHRERQVLTDKIVDALRIAIGKTPTLKLVDVSKSICDRAMLNIEFNHEQF